MRIPNRDTVEQIKKKYPPGTRIELISMKDPYSPVPPGTRGTVRMVDDAGTIHPKFDNGRTLGIIVGEDEFMVLDSVTTVCYGEEKLWDSRQEAKEFFIEALKATESSERERYAAIYAKLIVGKKYCTDDLD
jgi:hypothetical protein